MCFLSASFARLANEGFPQMGVLIHRKTLSIPIPCESDAMLMRRKLVVACLHHQKRYIMKSPGVIHSLTVIQVVVSPATIQLTKTMHSSRPG